MLCGYLYNASRRRLFRGALSMTGRWKEKSSNYVGTQVIFPVASHSGVHEEYHSKVQDPQPQRPGSGIEKYGTKAQEGIHVSHWRTTETFWLQSSTNKHRSVESLFFHHNMETVQHQDAVKCCVKWIVKFGPKLISSWKMWKTGLRSKVVRMQRTLWRHWMRWMIAMNEPLPLLPLSILL